MSFRASHLLRAGFESRDQLREHAEAHAFEGDLAIPVLRRPAGLDRPLLRELRGEYDALLAQLRDHDRLDETDWSVEFVKQVALDGRWDVAASVAGADTAHISLSTGLFLALDDALLNAFSQRSFFSARADQFALDGFSALIAGEEVPTRYQDYEHAAVLHGDELRDALTRYMPLDPVRLAQVDLILGLAIRWVILHEQAHALLGHFGLRRIESGLDAFKLEETALFADADSPARARESYCLELQADALATQMLVLFGLSDAMLTTAGATSYEQTVAENPRRDAGAVRLTDRHGRLRALILASLAAPLLFELRRQRAGRGSASHPPPSTRVLGVCSTAVSTFGDIVKFEAAPGAPRDDEYETASLKPAFLAVTLAMIDLDIMARSIGLTDGQYRSEIVAERQDHPPDGDRFAPLTEDFFGLFRGREFEPRLETAAARMFWDLQADSEQLYERLAPHAKIKGGR